MVALSQMLFSDILLSNTLICYYIIVRITSSITKRSERLFLHAWNLTVTSSFAHLSRRLHELIMERMAQTSCWSTSIVIAHRHMHIKKLTRRRDWNEARFQECCSGGYRSQKLRRRFNFASISQVVGSSKLQHITMQALLLVDSVLWKCKIN